MLSIVVKTNKKMNALFEFFKNIDYFLDCNFPKELKNIICARAINLPPKVIEKNFNY